MSENAEGWLQRAEQFTGRVGMLSAGPKSGEALTFAISMASEFYGPSSPQVELINRRVDTIARERDTNPQVGLYEFALGCIRNMAAEIRGGLVKGMRLRITGEILADLVGMAKDALAEKSVEVAAVLSAAAFEDLMRRLADEKAGITSRVKLDQVLSELKDKGILQGGEPGVAQTFLKFRNDSLHADWKNVTESQVASCLGLLDSLIVKHLS
ncbi:MAG TPA: hypothetical protein VIW68_11055 [Candidatus Sulfotelmatobacter sp.]